ncbi:MAG: 30S ribosomal protein S20 [Myxococcales bacterium]|nr:30S ribosomal protein S20 [Myxococcales bacterium]
MANHVSAEKRIRQTAKRTLRNRHIRSTVRTYVKAARAAIAAGDKAQAEAAVAVAARRIDMAVSKGVYHRRTGSRHISRLMKQAAAL